MSRAFTRSSSSRAPAAVLVGCAAVSSASLASCAPAFAPSSLVNEPRVLAIVADPPEAVPGRAVTLTPLVVAPSGTLASDAFDASWWRCPDADSDALGDFQQCTVAADRVTVGEGVPYVDTVPLDLFGPLPDPTEPPPDPASSTLPDKALGAILGYWRVVGLRVKAGDTVVEGFKREPVFSPVALGVLDERLAGLDVRVEPGTDVIIENQNPLLTGVTVHEDTADGATVTKMQKGRTYVFVPGYDDRSLQTYASLEADLTGLDVTDPEAIKALSADELAARFTRVARCEIPTFNWFVTSGTVRNEITVDEGVINRVFDPRGVACASVEGEVRSPGAVFTAPGGEGDDEHPAPDDGVLHGWVVMRDGRGGAAVRSFDVTVE